MLIKTLLNSIENYPGFVYENPILIRDSKDRPVRLEIPVRARKGSQGICSSCSTRRPGYDHLNERRFQFIPLWGVAVVLIYAMRRVDCPTCGVKVEEIPWAAGKSPVTRSLAIFIGRWARLLSWQEVSRQFNLGWHQVFAAVKWMVDYGLARRNLDDVTAIGVDEVHFGKGNKYSTLVYQLNGSVRRLLYVGKTRTAKTLLRFFLNRENPFVNKFNLCARICGNRTSR